MIVGFANSYSAPPLTAAKRIPWESPWHMGIAKLISRRLRHGLWEPGLGVQEWMDLKGVTPVCSIRDGLR